MKKITDLISIDKLLHFVISFVIVVTLFNMLILIGLKDFILCIVVSTIITFLIGVGKEFYDKFRKGTYFSFGDLFADIIGIIYGLTLVII